MERSEIRGRPFQKASAVPITRPNTAAPSGLRVSKDGEYARHLPFFPAGPMSLEDQANAFTQQIVEFARTHEIWAAPIVGALAFGESLAFISLLIPAWTILVALGALIGQS